jgi:hypothetical protein
MSAFQLDTTNIESFHLRYVNEETFNEKDLMVHLANSISANFNNLNQNLTQDNNYVSMSFFAYPGVPLQSDSTIDDFLNTNNLKNLSNDKIIFLLCPERAPSCQKNEIALKCHLDQKLDEASSEKVVEIIINLNECKVKELTQKLVDKMNLKPLEHGGDDEMYYLQTIGWMGDPENVLNNFDQECISVPLKHNQTLMITKGKLIPPNHIKIRAWISNEKSLSTEDSVQNLTRQLNEQKFGDDEVILNEFLETKYKGFKLLDELIVSNGLTLEELKVLIQSLLLDRSIVDTCEYLRLRVLKKLNFDSTPRFQMKKSLYEWNKPLKQLHLMQETDLFVQNLEEEDCFNQGNICFYRKVTCYFVFSIFL